MKSNKEHPAFQIIKKLNPSEKAYFKKYAFKAKNAQVKDYASLFDILDKMPVYNQSILIGHKKLTSVFKKNISSKLNTLFQKLISAQIEYKKSNSLILRFFEGLEEYFILRNMQLNTLAEKKLKKLTNQAEELRLYSFSFFLNHLSLLDAVNDTELAINKKVNRLNAADVSFEQLSFFYKIDKYGFLMEKLIQDNGGVILKTAENKEVAKRLSKEILELYSHVDLEDVFSKTILFSQYLLIELMCDNIETLDELVNEFIDEISPLLKETSDVVAFNTTPVFYTIISFAIYLENYSLAKRTISVFYYLSKKIESSRYASFLVMRKLYVEIAETFCNFETLTNEKVNDIISRLNENKNKHIEYIEVATLFMQVLFMNKYFEEVTTIGNTILNERYSERVRDRVILIKYITALAYLRLDQIDLFESLMRSTYRMLQNYPHFPFQKRLLHLFKSVNGKEWRIQSLEKDFGKLYTEVSTNATGTEMIKANELKMLASFAFDIR